MDMNMNPDEIRHVECLYDVECVSCNQNDSVMACVRDITDTSTYTSTGHAGGLAAAMVEVRLGLYG